MACNALLSLGSQEVFWGDLENPLRAEDGHRPLHHAARHGYVDSARELLRQGADANARTLDGDRPIDIARKFHQKGVEDLLVPHSLQVDDAPPRGEL